MHATEIVIASNGGIVVRRLLGCCCFCYLLRSCSVVRKLAVKVIACQLTRLFIIIVVIIIIISHLSIYLSIGVCPVGQYQASGWTVDSDESVCPQID